MVAKRLGFYEKFSEGGKSDLDWVKKMFQVTDISKYISWEEFEKKGYWVVPLPKNYKSTPALRWYAEGRKRDTPDWGPERRRDDGSARMAWATGYPDRKDRV